MTPDDNASRVMGKPNQPGIRTNQINNTSKFSDLDSVDLDPRSNLKKKLDYQG
jgi:hypothetical protein